MSDYTTKILQHGNCTIVIHRPILSKEETASIERQVMDAMCVVMKSYIKQNQLQ